MTQRRVFSTPHTINFIDYNNLKNGNEVIKTTKNNNEYAIFNKYISYAQRKTINNSYFNFLNNEINVISPLGNLRNNNTSFLSPQNKNNLEDHNNNCILNNNQLLPHGNIIKKGTTAQSFNNNLKISKWCNKYANCMTNCGIKNNKHIIKNITKIKVYHECKCGEMNRECLCIGTKFKPLFI